MDSYKGKVASALKSPPRAIAAATSTAGICEASKIVLHPRGIEGTLPFIEENAFEKNPLVLGDCVGVLIKQHRPQDVATERRETSLKSSTAKESQGVNMVAVELGYRESSTVVKTSTPTLDSPSRAVGIAIEAVG
ncbi:hypothetical protein ACH5RR_013703 [Cinchona calisaya]|uniref:Uncharacterized protein n=1 Tax=Cinchona calisaya TaxID=153742 RepID=A0ABD3A0S9_9GENT